MLVMSRVAASLFIATLALPLTAQTPPPAAYRSPSKTPSTAPDNTAHRSSPRTSTSRSLAKTASRRKPPRCPVSTPSTSSSTRKATARPPAYSWPMTASTSITNRPWSIRNSCPCSPGRDSAAHSPPKPSPKPESKSPSAVSTPQSFRTTTPSSPHNASSPTPKPACAKPTRSSTSHEAGAGRRSRARRCHQSSDHATAAPARSSGFAAQHRESENRARRHDLPRFPVRLLVRMTCSSPSSWCPIPKRRRRQPPPAPTSAPPSHASNRPATMSASPAMAICPPSASTFSTASMPTSLRRTPIIRQRSGRSTLPDYQVPYRHNLGYSAQATLNIPVWNWGATRSKVKQAEFKRQQAELDLTLAQRTLQGNLASAYREAQSRSGSDRFAAQFSGPRRRKPSPDAAALSGRRSHRARSGGRADHPDAGPQRLRRRSGPLPHRHRNPSDSHGEPFKPCARHPSSRRARAPCCLALLARLRQSRKKRKEAEAEAAHACRSRPGHAAAPSTTSSTPTPFSTPSTRPTSRRRSARRCSAFSSIAAITSSRPTARRTRKPRPRRRRAAKARASSIRRRPPTRPPPAPPFPKIAPKPQPTCRPRSRRSTPRRSSTRTASSCVKQGALAQKLVDDAKVAMVQAQSQLDTAQRHLQALQPGQPARADPQARKRRSNAAKAHYESASRAGLYAEIRSPDHRRRRRSPALSRRDGRERRAHRFHRRYLAGRRARQRSREGSRLHPRRHARRRITGPDGDSPAK